MSSFSDNESEDDVEDDDDKDDDDDIDDSEDATSSLERAGILRVRLVEGGMVDAWWILNRNEATKVWIWKIGIKKYIISIYM